MKKIIILVLFFMLSINTFSVSIKAEDGVDNNDEEIIQVEDSNVDENETSIEIISEEEVPEEILEAIESEEDDNQDAVDQDIDETEISADTSDNSDQLPIEEDENHIATEVIELDDYYEEIALDYIAQRINPGTSMNAAVNYPKSWPKNNNPIDMENAGAAFQVSFSKKDTKKYYVKFTTSSNTRSYYYFTFKNNSCSQGIRFQIIDANSNEKLSRVVYNNGSSTVCTNVLQRSTVYYLAVSLGYDWYDATSGMVEFHIGEGVDAVPDTRTSATTIRLENRVESYLEGERDIDWFRITTNSSTGYEIRGKSYIEDIKLTICDANEKQVFSRYYYDNYDESVDSLSLSPNTTYYVKVESLYWSEDTISRYAFTIQLDPVTSFVQRLYRLCFNREADSSGLTYYVSRLKEQRMTAADAVKEFFTSNEMKNLNLTNAQYIDRCYKVMMNRNSDAGGQQYWETKIKEGLSRLYVAKGFVDSNEFTNICMGYGLQKGTINLTEARDQNPGVSAFVARCYTQALGRDYEADGLNFHCRKILNARNKKETAKTVASDGFFHSNEFLAKNTSNQEYIRILYRTFLGREADQGGLNYHLGNMSRGRTRDQILNDFANSNEFNGIMASYGIY